MDNIYNIWVQCATLMARHLDYPVPRLHATCHGQHGLNGTIMQYGSHACQAETGTDKPLPAHGGARARLLPAV